jgi:tRNA threonylcarbamoyl adenosine modification protein YeaZ
MRLVIDSATAACSVALLSDNGDVLGERHEIVGRGHAERLIPAIADLLQGSSPSTIIVDCGPGSFTGVRVGVAAAHGLAIGWRVPVSGYSSLAVLAAAARSERVAIAIEGGHGELFVQSYRGDPMAPLHEARSLVPSAAADLLAEELVVGSGADALVAARGFGRAVFALPRAADARFLPPSLQILPPRPIYARAPDARPLT